MLSASEFTDYQIQLSLFPSVADLRPAAGLRYSIRSDWGAEYGATPTSIQLPPGLPTEIPEVVLSSEDGSTRLEIARGRINLLQANLPGEGHLNINNSIMTLAERGWAIFKDQNVAVGRLAAVATRYIRVENPGKALAEHFFDERWLNAPLNRPEGLEIHAHKVFPLQDDLPVNSWVRIRTGIIGGDAYNAITVEQDINSLEQERQSRRFDYEATTEFYSIAASQFDVILRLYFPSS